MYQTFSQSNLVDFEPQENHMAIAMTEAGLGMTILPGLDLVDLSANHRVKALPLAEGLTRTISLLCPRESERTPLTAAFLSIARATVEKWRAKQGGT